MKSFLHRGDTTDNFIKSSNLERLQDDGSMWGGRENGLCIHFGTEVGKDGSFKRSVIDL